MFNKMIQFKTMTKIATLIFVALIVFACKSTTSNKSLGGESINKTEGWMNDDTYEMVVAGAWDRARYFVEGEDDPEEGKDAKSSLLLQQDAKRSAITQAMRNFKEKMGAYVKSKTGVEDGKLIGDVIQSGLEGISIAPQAVKENYTKRYDARISFRFAAKGLKRTVDSIANQVLKKKNEGI